MARMVRLGRLWRRLRDRLRPAPIASADALGALLEERAALIAQKCATDYCRGKTGLASYALFTEKPFLDAFEVCRWETFVAVLGDLLMVAEGHLRPHVPAEQGPCLREGLARLHAAILARLPAPEHRTKGWDDAIPSFKARLEVAGLAAPRLAREIADYSARRLFETLPIHASMRELDEQVVYGAVRFRMVAVSQEMQQRIAAADLARELIG